jgi:alkylated DNA repair dioxygenase AlkB
MMVAHQRSLFATGDPAIDVDAKVARNWLSGADAMLDVLVDTVDWRQGRRRMWDRMVDDPRLSRWYRDGDPLPHPAFAAIRSALAARYSVPFGTVGLNYYRDGDDSVAPHSDRELRNLDDGFVAIVTLGARRPFLLRPKGGGRSLDLAPASGDLLVLGGACQVGWEHGVPKVATAGPRISATWRWAETSTATERGQR